MVTAPVERGVSSHPYQGRDALFPPTFPYSGRDIFLFSIENIPLPTVISLSFLAE